MEKVLYMLQDWFSPKEKSGIGLSQFKSDSFMQSSIERPIINNKNVKISDLLRRS